MKFKNIFSTILAAAVLMCVCALSACEGKKTIDLKDYVSVTFSGCNGSGYAKVDLDVDAMLPLFNDGAMLWLYDCFSQTSAPSGGTLSNGDTLKVKFTYNETLMKNANVNVTNTELSFPVTGLKEKEKLDLSQTIKLNVSGVSPECRVSLDKSSLRGWAFTITTEDGETLDDYALTRRQFRDGEKITAALTEGSLKSLSEQYTIDKPSVELTVNCGSKYILSAADLSAENRRALDDTARSFAEQKTAAALGGTDRAVLNDAISAASGLNVGTLYAGCSQRLEKLEVKELDSAYVGIDYISTWGAAKEEKYAYYLYGADIKYYAKNFFDVYDDETTIVLVVKIKNPMITPEGLKYSEMTIAAAKDIDTAKARYAASDKMEKLL